MTRTILTTLAGILILAAPWLATLNARAEDKPAQPESQPSGAAEVLRLVHDPYLADQSMTRLIWTSGDAQQKVVQQIQSGRAHQDAIASLQQCQSCHGGVADYLSIVNGEVLHTVRLSADNSPWVGITVGPADDVLRSQLRLPEGTGVVITQVIADGPAARSGVAEHDILLSVNGQPVAGGDALDGLVKAWKQEAPPLTLKLLREGQPLEKQVTPSVEPQVQFLKVFSDALQHGNQYRIGVSASAPDETLRKQLKLGDAGVVVTAVAGGTPAEKQGVRVNDVLTAANHKPLKDPADLKQAVQDAAESPVELELLRGGVPLKITVTPEKEPALSSSVAWELSKLVDPQREVMLVQPALVSGWAANVAATQPATTQSTTQAAAGAADEPMGKISAQLEELRATVEALRAELKASKEKSDGR